MTSIYKTILAGIACLSVATPAVAETPLGEQGQEYLLVGYSMFDFSLEGEDQNVFGAGGKLCSYPVYIATDANKGTFQVYNLVNLSSDIKQIPAQGAYDAATGTMTLTTEPDFRSLDKASVVAASGNSYIILQAGNPVGAGYWTDANALTINSEANGDVLTPASGFGAFGYEYDDYWEDYNATNLYDVMFNTHLYKVREGVNILPSTFAINVGECYVGETKQVKFSIINSGSEESDYLLKAIGEGFSANVKSGFLNPKEAKEIVLTFAPTNVGTYTGIIKVQSEGEPIEITVTGEATPFPEFAKIVKNGADKMTFSTSNEYPWSISDDITDGPVAVSSNTGVDDSSSWLAVSVNIPEGDKGVLRWNGFFDPHYGTRDRFSITDNGEEVYSTPVKHQICDIDGTINLLAGDHKIVFSYDKELSVFPQDVKFGNDRVWLKSLDLEVNEYMAQAASLRNGNVDFERFYLVTNTVESTQGGPALVNEGYETLKIEKIKSDGVFFARTSTDEIAPEAQAELTVGFRATEPGDYTGDVKVVTSSGEFPIHCHVLVEPSPDYSAIVKQGEFVFVPDNSYPFVVEDGTAYNCTAGVADTEETLSLLTAVFTVPNGKIGKLTWDGQADTQANAWTADYGVAMIDNDSYNMHFYHGHDDAGNYSVNPSEVYFGAGGHLISWGYVQCGDGQTFGNDRLSISNLSLELLDEIPTLEVWAKTPIDLGEVFDDSFNTVTLEVANLTGKTTAFQTGYTDGDFVLDFDDEMNSEIPGLSLGTVEITYTPTKAGNAEGELTLHTSAGDIAIPVKGYGIDTSVLAFHEDFEDGFKGWKAIDANKDRYMWQSDVAGTYSRTGLGSAMIGTVFSEGTDDYLVSPEFTVPTEEPTLEYWRRYTKVDNNDYDVMIGEGSDPVDFDVVYTDEGHTMFEFEKVTVDLSEYAGRTVRLAFHNRTAEKQSVLILDDIAVAAKGSLSIDVPTAEVTTREYYNLQGVRLSTPPTGFYIEKVTYSDGRTNTFKRINK